MQLIPHFEGPQQFWTRVVAPKIPQMTYQDAAGAMVVAQLVERSLPIPEICVLNPVCINVNGTEETKIKKKRLRMAH